jgi:hypothetical protein
VGTTPAGLLVLLLSCTTAAGGAFLVKRAQARPAPIVPGHRVVPGSVIEVQATPCPRRRPGTCFRTIAEYRDNGQPLQVASRGIYRPAAHARGDALSVMVEADGTAWIDEEWTRRLADRQADYARQRDFPLRIGWLLVGCAACGVLLGLGLIFWVAPDEAPSRT